MGGFAWLSAQTIVQRLVTLGAQLVLAAMLAPADFGTIAIALGVSTVVGTLTGFGVEDVVLQRGRLVRLWAGTAFAISLGLGLLSGLLLAGAAPVVAKVYENEALAVILLLAAAAAPLNALATVPMLRLRQALRFRALSISGIGEAVATASLSVYLAAAGYGALSFAIPIPVVAAAKALWLWSLQPTSLRRPSPRAAQVALLRSSRVFLHRLTTAVISQADNLILSFFASTSVVGAYFFAYRLAFQPISMLAGNIQGVLFPLLVRERGRETEQRDATLQCASLLNFVLFPLCFLQAAIAEPVLLLVFGEKWRASIPLLQVLSVGVAFEGATRVPGALLSARGQFGPILRYTLYGVPLFLAMVFTGVKFASAQGASFAVASYYALTCPLWTYAALRKDGVSPGRVAKLYLAPVACGALAVGGAHALSSLVPADALIMRCLVLVMASGFSYVAIVFFFARSDVVPLLAMLSRHIRLKARSAPEAP